MSGRNIKELVSKVIPDYRDDFTYFLENIYRGDFDDSEGAVMDAFNKWIWGGAIRRTNSATEKWRLFIDVPFPKKDDFKRDFRGKWDPTFKCWYVVTTISELGKTRDSLASSGYHPIVALSDGSNHVRAVYNASLAKTKFSTADFSSAGATSFPSAYRG